MSSEESYRAILRYLTNEREPYAPGTEGNVKRKIRKAAACYVVRGGTLYYQRRQRHRKTFAELEVVLQPERRQGLIEAAHLGPGGTHHTRHQTWHDLSKTYWWRGERRRGGGLAGYDPPTRPACAVASLGARAPGPCGRHSATPRPRERAARTGGGRQSSRTSPQEGGPAGGGRTLARGGASGGFPRGRASRGGWGAASLGPPLRAPREGGRAGLEAQTPPLGPRWLA